MSTKELAVLAILDGDRRALTASQIAAQVNSVLDDRKQPRMNDVAMRKLLVEMERNGVLDKEVDGQRVERFKRRMARYAFGFEDGHWRILRVNGNATDTTFAPLTDDMTEAEVRCCTTALNELERKAIALIRRR